jgi:hypothetical protein
MHGQARGSDNVYSAQCCIEVLFMDERRYLDNTHCRLDCVYASVCYPRYRGSLTHPLHEYMIQLMVFSDTMVSLCDEEG